jgi:hypothetical protein
MIQLSYGPPGAVGVKHLQYLSDDADYVSSGIYGIAKWAGIAAAATWGYAEVMGYETLRKRAMATAVASFLVGILTRP